MPVVRVGGLVEIEGRTGVLFDRVIGPTLYQRVTSGPAGFVRSAGILADLHRVVHAARASGLPSQKDYLARAIRTAELADDVKAAALARLQRHGDRVCYGKFHLTNVILSPGGPIVIDCQKATCGDPAGDVALTLLILRAGGLPPGWFQRRLRGAARRLFCHLYLRRYLRLSRTSRQQVASWELPVAAALLSTQEFHGVATHGLLRELAERLARQQESRCP